MTYNGRPENVPPFLELVIISNHALKVMIGTNFLKSRSKLFQQSQRNCLLSWVKSSKIISQTFEILCSIFCYYFSRTLYAFHEFLQSLGLYFACIAKTFRR